MSSLDIGGWQTLVGQVPGHHHGHRKLHHFGRLETNETQVQPALCTFADIAHHQHGDQQRQPESVQPGRPALQPLRPQLGNDYHATKGDAQANNLAGHQLIVATGRAVQHKQSQRRDCQQAKQQRRVKVQDMLPVTLAGIFTAAVE